MIADIWQQYKESIGIFALCHLDLHSCKILPIAALVSNPKLGVWERDMLIRLKAL